MCYDRRYERPARVQETVAPEESVVEESAPETVAPVAEVPAETDDVREYETV